MANEFENVVAIKEASGDMNLFAQLIAQRPEGFKVYSGDDFLSPFANYMGADGCISVIANVIPQEFSNMMHLSMKGDVAGANELFFKYRKLMDLMFIESNPIPVKTVLAAMGLIQEAFRSPMCTMEVGTKELLLAEVKKLGII